MSAEVELLEALRYEPQAGYYLRERHVARLLRSARALGYTADRARVDARLDEHAATVREPAKVRLRLARSGDVFVSDEPLGETPPVVLGIAATRVDPADARLHHKTTDRTPYRDALASVPGVDDVLLVNTRGELTESTRANVAVCREGRWLTPPLQSGLLPGTFRAELLEAGQLEEAVLRPEDLSGAEVKLLNSVRRWIAVAELRRQTRP